MDLLDIGIKNEGLFLIAGPCVVEGEDLCLGIAEKLVEITSKLKLPYIFKASYRKANRTKDQSFQGIGDQEALRILEKVKTEFNIPVLTDIHESSEVQMAANVADVLQIPAFLARQTNLLKAAANSGRWVNIKKGQFMSPESMSYAVEKIRNNGNNNVMVTERGSFFGYQDLIVDFRGLVKMKSFNCPVIFDATHSLQQPNQKSGVSGGNPEYIIPMARAAVAVGVNGLFVETHPNPAKAFSDGENMMPLDQMENLLKQLLRVHNSIKN